MIFSGKWNCFQIYHVKSHWMLARGCQNTDLYWTDLFLMLLKHQMRKAWKSHSCIHLGPFQDIAYCGLQVLEWAWLQMRLKPDAHCMKPSQSRQLCETEIYNTSKHYQNWKALCFRVWDMAILKLSWYLASSIIPVHIHTHVVSSTAPVYLVFVCNSCFALIFVWYYYY